GTIAVEFLLRDEWDEERSASKGTYLVPLPEDLSQTIGTWALDRLRALLPKIDRSFTPADFSREGVIGSQLTDLLIRPAHQSPWPE
ncbi:hypothetical protein, partial [Nocardiopsis listeri]|uniref:hypothetical protein n=1 Tax=Nocardiopsis listeri TaxID=53440 RepID=UPI000A7929E8